LFSQAIVSAHHAHAFAWAWKQILDPNAAQDGT